MPSTLFKFFQDRGEKLPTISERAKIFAQRGLGTAAEYRGTEKQNISLLASFQQGTPSGKISGRLDGTAPSRQVSGPPSVTGGLGNFRIALKSALNEAAQARSAARIQQTFPTLGGVPGTMGDIARMIRGSVAPPVESIFSDIMKEFESTREFALTMASRYPDAGISQNDTPETVTTKVSDAPSFKNKAPEVIGSASTGYLQWDDVNGAWTPVKGFPGNADIEKSVQMEQWATCLQSNAFNPSICGIPNESKSQALAAAQIPLAKSESQIRTGIRGMKAQNLDYDAMVDLINADPYTANKAESIFILDQMEGVIEPTDLSYEEFIKGAVPTTEIKKQPTLKEINDAENAKRREQSERAKKGPLGFGDPIGDVISFFGFGEEDSTINKLYK